MKVRRTLENSIIKVYYASAPLNLNINGAEKLSIDVFSVVDV